MIQVFLIECLSNIKTAEARHPVSWALEELNGIP